MSDNQSKYMVFRILPSAGSPEYSVYTGCTTWTDSTFFAGTFSLQVARLLVERLDSKPSPYIYGYIKV